MYHNVCHIEFEVTDLAKGRAFYEGLFGWKFSDFEMPDMVVFGADNQHIGGLMRVDAVQPGNSPSIWFRVKSVDESVATATGLGGAVVSEKSPVPGVGWSACVADPFGNHVGMVQFSEDA